MNIHYRVAYEGDVLCATQNFLFLYFQKQLQVLHHTDEAEIIKSKQLSAVCTSRLCHQNFSPENFGPEDLSGNSVPQTNIF